MQINSELQNEVMIITIEGRLDANTSGSLESRFLQYVEEGRNLFIFNLSGLSFVSSAGLRSLLVAAKKTKAIHGKLVLTQMNEHVREVFDMSGFSTIFTIYATDAEALQALS
jgi:anti-anti-sigma factor